MSRSIHLNADIGELPGAAGRALDGELLKLVSQCNIACGGHAGDEISMRETVRRAAVNGVQIGAHPSFPDREGFGRRDLQIAKDELTRSLTDQISALITIAEQEGASVSYMKPHGALYNLSARDTALSTCIVEAAIACRIPALMSLPGSVLGLAACDQGLSFIPEAFADRAYEDDGTLTPRTIDGAVIDSVDARIDQALAIAQGRQVTSRNGKKNPCPAETICVHGDSDAALETTRELRRALEMAGFTVGAPAT